jgi:ABC-type multidrug transport system fused ATPase/permease subunit
MNTLAYDFPLLSIIFSIFWFFLLIAWIMCLFQVIVDIFRSHDMGGGAKALWLILVIIFPFLGVLIYLVARGRHMTEHAMADAQKQDAAMQAYIRDAAGSPADEVAKLSQLRDQGVITDAEFQAGKNRVLGTSAS